MLDLGLPKVDGVEVLRHVRGEGGTVPVIVLSARVRAEQRRQRGVGYIADPPQSGAQP